MFRIRRQNNGMSTGIFNEYSVFREKRSNDQHFILWRFDNGFQGNRQRCRCATGHIKIIGLNVRIIRIIHILG